MYVAPLWIKINYLAPAPGIEPGEPLAGLSVNSRALVPTELCRNNSIMDLFFIVLAIGVEPITYRLQGDCAANCATPAFFDPRKESTMLLWPASKSFPD